jgi:hypothetical protein
VLSSFWPMKSRGGKSRIFLLTSVNNSTQSKPLLANISSSDVKIITFRGERGSVNGTGIFFSHPSRDNGSVAGPRDVRKVKNQLQGGRIDGSNRCETRPKSAAGYAVGIGTYALAPVPCGFRTHTHTRVHTPAHSCGQ